MGEVQKAYNAYAGIIKRESDEGYETVENLTTGPLALAKDHEWGAFVIGNPAFVDPRIPVRNYQSLTYPGKDEPAAAEVKAGMLERKSKYLKSYTPGWWVLPSLTISKLTSVGTCYRQHTSTNSNHRTGSLHNSPSCPYLWRIKNSAHIPTPTPHLTNSCSKDVKAADFINRMPGCSEQNPMTQ